MPAPGSGRWIAIAASLLAATGAAACSADGLPPEPPSSPAPAGLSAPVTNAPVTGQGAYVNPLRKP